LLQNDILAWMIAYTQNDAIRSESRNLVIRLLSLNFAAIHTSSMVCFLFSTFLCLLIDRVQTFTHAMYTLAARPEYIAPLREEVEAVVEAEGCTKLSLLNMPKLDSFLRESTRVNTFNGRTPALFLLICPSFLTHPVVALMRLVLQDYTFGDGTVVPAGTMVASPTWPHHREEDFYPNPETFDPWRFVPAGATAAVPGDAEEEKASGKSESRKAFTTTDLQYIPFGHGGRTQLLVACGSNSTVCRSSCVPGPVLRRERAQSNACARPSQL
jgi:hypothetical protein